MKRILTLILALALVLSLFGCSSGKKPEKITVYVLAGPTGVGAVNLWDKAAAGQTELPYEFVMAGSNEEIVAAVSQGTADIACVATNLASTLYNKTEGNVRVLAVNTLGVLSMLSMSDIGSMEELKGKTIYSPGQGANPEYILRYVLSGNGIDVDNDVTVQFVGEGSELLTVWQNDPEAVIMAPQPVATALVLQNEGAKTVFDMTEEWNKIAGDESTLMMGCVIASKDFVSDYHSTVEQFLKDYEDSIKAASDDLDNTAALCEQYGLIAKAPMAKKAIPACNLCFVTGDEMFKQLGGYLQVMFDANPKSIGGKMPGADFYFHG